MQPNLSARKSLLMADDEPGIRRIMVEIMEFAFPEIEVVTAVDGIDCIEKCRNRRFDLLLLNNKMPNATGTDVLEFLKKSGSTMPVWVISGSYFGQETEDKVRELGGRGIIPKPPDLHNLIAVVEEELGVKSLVPG